MAGSPGPGNHYVQVNSNLKSQIFVHSHLFRLSTNTNTASGPYVCTDNDIGGPQMAGFPAGQQPPPPYPGQMGVPAHHQPGTPMFVAPPPKPQRLLHSEAYLKYIEGLRADSSTISKWDQTLKSKLVLLSQGFSKGVTIHSNSF